MKNIFITGINGWLGQKLAMRFLKEGHACTGMDVADLIVPGLADRENISYISADLLSIKSHAEALNGIDVIIHLASAVHRIPKNKKEIDEFYDINVKGTELLLEQAVKHNVPKFIFISTVAVMGETSTFKLNENDECHPDTVYGKTKLGAEKLVNKFRDSKLLSTVILRLTTVYGEGDKGNVVKLIQSINKGQYRIIGSGKNKKSMVYIENVIDAILLVINKWEKISGKTYIVSDGIDYSILEMAKTIASALDKEFSYIHIPEFLAYLFAGLFDSINLVTKIKFPLSIYRVKKLTSNTIYDSGKLQKELGYRPKYKLADGLKKEILWLKENNEI